MKVLVACEFSGVVRDAFLARGHDAYSCDLLPPMGGPCDRHIRGDVRELLREPWDLVIAHPPCTYLCMSGTVFLKKQPGRYQLAVEGAMFFRECLNANSPRIAVENPMHYGEASRLVGRKWDQVIQPYQFGHQEKKRTCLWLKGLPPLVATAVVAGPYRETGRMGRSSPYRASLRSITPKGVAEAMAAQWG